MFRPISTLDRYVDLPLDERLRHAVAQWRSRHGMSARRFGIKALGDPIFVFSHTRGRSVQFATADQRRPVWGHRGETNPQAVHSGVRKLRRKLGDDARNPRYILGERGLGYRMPEPDDT